jgi:hypothetical protein
VCDLVSPAEIASITGLQAKEGYKDPALRASDQRANGAAGSSLLLGTCDWDFPTLQTTILWISRETLGSSGDARTEFDTIRTMMGLEEVPSHQDGFGDQAVFNIDSRTDVTVLVLDRQRVITVELNSGSPPELPAGARMPMAKAITRLIVSRT